MMPRNQSEGEGADLSDFLKDFCPKGGLYSENVYREEHFSMMTVANPPSSDDFAVLYSKCHLTPGGEWQSLQNVGSAATNRMIQITTLADGAGAFFRLRSP
jgi:hypothetical protein